MLELTLLGVGLLLGGALAWAIVRVRLGAVTQVEHEGLRARIAGLEATADELRKQLTQRDLQLADAVSAADAERARRVDAQARYETTRQSLEEQQRLLDEARLRLSDTFKALSAQALRESQTSFVQMADAELGRRQQALEGVVKPLEEAVRRYDQHVRELEASRQHEAGSLQAQLRELSASSADLKREAGNLVTALRAPHVRGRWGELTLHRVVELAGMTEHCDYGEQVTVEGEGGRLRPDMVVHLPAGRDIVVDAKVPLSAYLDALGAASAEERAAALARHAQQVRHHMTQLAGKAYWEQFGEAPELVVMFIPGEAFVAAAAEHDPALIEDGMGRKVVVATPTTLVALLRAIAFGWRQERIAANAAEISELGRDLYRRLVVLADHVGDVGGALGKATAAYNRFVGSMETRVLPAARRFRDLGAAGAEDIAPLERLQSVPRVLAAPEFPQQPPLPDTEPAGGGSGAESGVV